jgi:peptide/nickel transport system permease protein
MKQWWISTFSGAAIFLTVLAFNLVGDGIREAMDPKIRWRFQKT